MRSSVYRQHLHLAYLYHNGEQMSETRHRNSVSKGVAVSSTGGREILMMAEQGDTIHLGATEMSSFHEIITCFEFIPTV